MESLGAPLEEEVGITAFANSCAGFQGVLKQRYSDFVVHEITDAQTIVRVRRGDSTVNPSQGEDAQGCVGKAEELPPQPSVGLGRIEALLGQGAKTKVETLLQRLGKLAEAPGPLEGGDKDEVCSAEGSRATSTTFLGPLSDKGTRTELHKIVRECFPYLQTETLDAKCVSAESGAAAEGPYVKVEAAARGRSKWRQGRKRARAEALGTDQPEGKKDIHKCENQHLPYLRFAMVKENKETQEVFNLLGRMLHLNPRAFTIAGTKDKRGVTTQQVAVLGLSKKKLMNLNSRLWGIRIGSCEYHAEPLRLGQLWGNRFIITLRNVTAKGGMKHIQTAIAEFHTSGFINFFGLQRFGSGNVRTHQIGMVLLKGQWQEAMDLLLQPREGEREEYAEFRRQYAVNGDVKAALKMVPRVMVAERCVLEGLRDLGQANLLGALQRIPMNMRRMYVHAYQSFLWNQAASFRVHKHGLQVVVGDLVQRRRVERREPGGEECISTTGLTDGPTVHVVTEADSATNKYSIEDVVLPLPGSAIRYPQNDVGQLYEDLAAQDGVKLKGSPHQVNDFSIDALPGGYRRLVQKPFDLKWRLLKYSGNEESLCVTDLDLLTQKVREGEAATIDAIDTKDPGMVHPVTPCEECTHGVHSEETAKHSEVIGLQIHMSLPSSSYATMAIRELLKGSTAPRHHKELNSQAAKSKDEKGHSHL
mmetsp:Transcript_6179/g.22735  ORF Transcript_6179/g.22735 Transcript_6179/m.22735 type:complete len:702 (+) Transcript_6179:121-2226(+)